MNRNVCILVCLAASSLALNSCIAAATTAVASAAGASTLNPVKAVTNLLSSGAPEQLDDCTVELQGSQSTVTGSVKPITEAFAFTDNSFKLQAGSISNESSYKRNSDTQGTLTKRSSENGSLIATSTYSLTFTDATAGTYAVETRSSDGQLISTGKGSFRIR